MDRECSGQSELGVLTQALRSHGLPFDSASLQDAFQDAVQGPALTEWVNTYLLSDTLLSLDELGLYTALEKSGKVEKLEAAPDFASLQPLGHQEIRDAIDELNRSTDAINKQTETLRQQQDALSRLLASDGKNDTARSQLESKQDHKWATNKKTLNLAVEELSQSLQFRLSELAQQSQGAGDSLHRTINATLQSDDKLLASLQKLGRELEMEDPEQAGAVDGMRDICARLIKYTVETIRTRLDRLYLETLLASPQSGMCDAGAVEEAAGLQEEVESLYAEILPVAQMSIEQQFLEPALKSLGSSNGQNLNRSAVAVDYISSCLDYLLDHVEKFSARIEVFNAHQAATYALVSAARDELAVQIESTTEQQRHSTVAGLSPIRRPRTNTASPVRRHHRSGSSGANRRRSSGGLIDEQPLDQLLRTLALSLPYHEESSSGSMALPRLPPSEAAAQLAFLTNTLAERTAKAENVARNVQESFESAAAAQLADARWAMAAVRDSMLAETPFGPPRLVDPEIEASVAWLADEVAAVRERLAEAEVGVGKAAGRNVKREELIVRWGG